MFITCILSSILGVFEDDGEEKERTGERGGDEEEVCILLNLAILRRRLSLFSCKVGEGGGDEEEGVGERGGDEEFIKLSTIVAYPLAMYGE